MRNAANTEANGKDHYKTIVISDPQKINSDGGVAGGSYISYQVKFNTSVTRRRFGDFVSLRQSLVRANPTVIVPPLPSKHRLEYMDRFGDEFVERRRVSLERFLNRCYNHSSLRSDLSLNSFLTTDNWIASSKVDEKDLIDNVSDVLVNAFTKVKKQDSRITEIVEEVQIYEENFSAVEKNFVKAIKFLRESSDIHLEFADCLDGLSNLEIGNQEQLIEFATLSRHFSNELRRMSFEEEKGFVGYIHDHIGYCSAIKEVLKTRDSKQIEFESLTNYLNQQLEEKEKLQNPSRANSSLGGFLRNKMDELKGSDPEQQRLVRLAKVEAKVAELKVAVETSNDVNVRFSEAVVKEKEEFEKGKVLELKEMLIDTAQNHIGFFKKSLSYYDTFIDHLEKRGIRDEPEMI